MEDSRYKFEFNEDCGILTMTIKNVRKEDSGVYRMKAENGQGVAISGARLTVEGLKGCLLSKAHSPLAFIAYPSSLLFLSVNTKYQLSKNPSSITSQSF